MYVTCTICYLRLPQHRRNPAQIVYAAAPRRDPLVHIYIYTYTLVDACLLLSSRDSSDDVVVLRKHSCGGRSAEQARANTVVLLPPLASNYD